MLKVLYFDLGGVVIQDFFSGGEVYLAKKLGLPVKQVYDAYVATDYHAYCKDEMSDNERWEAFVKKVGLPESKIDLCIREFYNTYQPLPEIIEFISNLKKEGKYQLGILSDQPTGVAKYLRKDFSHIFKLFDPSLTIISAEVKHSKRDDDLAIYTLALEKAHVAPGEILFIDNSQPNLDMAKKVGFNTYLFDIEHKPIKEILLDLSQQL